MLNTKYFLIDAGLTSDDAVHRKPDRPGKEKKNVIFKQNRNLFPNVLAYGILFIRKRKTEGVYLIHGKQCFDGSRFALHFKIG